MFTYERTVRQQYSIVARDVASLGILWCNNCSSGPVPILVVYEKPHDFERRVIQNIEYLEHRLYPKEAQDLILNMMAAQPDYKEKLRKVLAVFWEYNKARESK